MGPEHKMSPHPENHKFARRCCACLFARTHSYPLKQANWALFDLRTGIFEGTARRRCSISALRLEAQMQLSARYIP